MKTNKILFIFLMVLFLFPLIAFGQAKSISKQVYDATVKEAQSNTDKRIRKERTTEKRYENSSLSATAIINQEFVPPDKSKWLITNTKKNSVEIIEIIYIGDFEYRKTNGGGWVKRNLKSGNGGGFGISGEDNSTKEYSLEEVKVGKETFQVFIVSTVNPAGISSEYKTWIKDKLIYKTTSNWSIYKIENRISESVRTYDYSPKNLKIEAPIVKTEAKRKPK